MNWNQEIRPGKTRSVERRHAGGQSWPKIAQVTNPEPNNPHKKTPPPRKEAAFD
jgi:hypothetical protein